METHGYAIDSRRASATDTCHGACGPECPMCGGKVEINFRPRDVRGDFFGIEDPKLEGEGGSEDTAGDDE